MQKIAKHITALILAVFLQVIALVTFAGDQPLNKYQQLEQACYDEAGTVNSAVVHTCSDEVFEAVRKDIEKYYQIAHKKMKAIDIKDVARLEAAHLAWKKYRDEHCKLMGDYVGSPMYSACPLDMNIARALELQQLSGE